MTVVFDAMAGRSRRSLLIGAALASLMGCSTAAVAAHIGAVVEAETLRPAPGSRISLALRMTPDPGWHGYWQNPGAAGAPTAVAWTSPPGVAIGPLRYPVPRRHVVQGLMSYVYDRSYALLMTLSVPKNLAAGTKLRIAGRARWLACSATLCVPEQARVAVDLVVGDGVVSPSSRTRFDGWRAKLPTPLGRTGSFTRQEGRLEIVIPMVKGDALTDPYFYPATDRMVDYSTPQRIGRRGNNLIIELKPAAGAALADILDGIIAIGPDRAFSLSARRSR